MNDTLNVPKTYEEFTQAIVQLNTHLSDLKFHMGHYVDALFQKFPQHKDDWVKDTGISKSSLYEYRQMARFWDDVGLSNVLADKLADLHAVRTSGLLTYSHFRDAMRVIRKQHKGQSRAKQMAMAVAYLDDYIKRGGHYDEISSDVAAVCNGEEPQRMAIRYDWDSRKHHVTLFPNLIGDIEEIILTLVDEKKAYCVKVYEVIADEGSEE